MHQPQTATPIRPDLDAAIRHLESVHRVIVARRNGAKVIPFPPRQAEKVRPQ